MGQEGLPTFSHRLFRGFLRYLRRYLRKHFTAVRLVRGTRPAPDPDRPLIVYSNHPSWWDPLVYMWLTGTLFAGREGYGPMDATALRKYGLFRRLGVFGVETGTRRGAAQFLRAARAVLARPGAILWVTAEGRFTDPRTRPVRIEPGIAHLARSVDRVVLLPLAIEYPFWNERLPETLLRFGEAVRVEDGPGDDVEAWTTLLERKLEANLDALAETARRRDPDAFETLQAGRTGVGGPYDLWRRLKAAVLGRKFRPAHGDEESR